MYVIAGMEIVTVSTWERGWSYVWLGPPPRVPTRREGRKGTRRDWKRAHPHGWRRRWGPVQPDHVLKIDGKIFCTPHQLAALRKAALGQARYLHNEDLKA